MAAVNTSVGCVSVRSLQLMLYRFLDRQYERFFCGVRKVIFGIWRTPLGALGQGLICRRYKRLIDFYTRVVA